MAGGAKAMKALQIWCRQRTDGYRDVEITDMAKSWRDGLAFCALIHRYRPDLIDFDSLSKENIYENNDMAFDVAQRELGIPALLDAEDMLRMKVPDRLSIITYVAQFYNYCKDQPQLGGPGVNKFKGGRYIGSKRHTHEAPSAPETKKFSSVATKTPDVAALPTHKEKTRTLGDTCTICQKKVYLLERHQVDGKFYHRSCYRESQNTNKPYKSILQAKTPTKENKVILPIQNKVPENVTSPTAKAKDNFFKSDTTGNRSTDSGYQSPTVGWRKTDTKTVLPQPRVPSPERHPVPKNVTSPKSPTSPMLFTVSNPNADVDMRSSNPEDIWVKKYEVKDSSPTRKHNKKLDSSPERRHRLGRNKSPDKPVLSTEKKHISERGNSPIRRTGRNRSPEKQHSPVRKNKSPLTSPIDDKLPLRNKLPLRSMDKHSPTDEKPKSPTSIGKMEPNTAVSRLDALVNNNKLDEDFDLDALVDKNTTAEGKIKAEKRKSGRKSGILPTHLKTGDFIPAGSNHPRPKPRSGSNSSDNSNTSNSTGLPSPNLKSSRLSTDDSPPKPARTFNRTEAKKGLQHPDPAEDPALSGLMQTLTDVRAKKEESKAKSNELKDEGNIEHTPRQRSTSKEVERTVISDSNIKESKSNNKKHETNNDNGAKNLRLETDKMQIKSQEPRKKRLAPKPRDEAIKTEWQKAAEERQIANKSKYNRFGSKMKDNVDSPSLRDKSGSDSPRPARPDSVPIARQRSPKPTRPKTVMDPSKDAAVLAEDNWCLKPADKNTITESTTVPFKSNSAMENDSSSRGRKTEAQHSPKPPRPNELPKMHPESEIHKNERTKVGKSHAANADKRQGHTLREVIQKKTKSLNPFDTDSEEELEEAVSVVEDKKTDTRSNPGRYNPFDLEEDDVPQEKPLEVVPSQTSTNAEISENEEQPVLNQNGVKDISKPSPTPRHLSPVPQGRKNLNPFESSEDESEVIETPGRKTRISPVPAKRNIKPVSPVPETRKKISVGKQFDFGNSLDTSVDFESSRDGNISDLEKEPKKKGRAPAPPRPISPPARATSPTGRHRKGQAPDRPLPPKRKVAAEPHISKDSIQRELEELDMKQTELELQGRELEEAIRKGDEEGSDDDGMLSHWFEMVNEKNRLLRRENELILISQQQEFENRQSDVEYQIRLLMNKPESKKTDSDKRKEEQLLEELIKIVTERSKIVDKMDMERIRAEEEDKQIAEVFAMKNMPVKNSVNTKTPVREENRIHEKQKKKR